jgi:hypothetical protein
MIEYRMTFTDVAVFPADKFPLHHSAIRVQLAGDPDGGYFLRLQQEDQVIEVDPEELPLLLEAAQKLLENVAQ